MSAPVAADPALFPCGRGGPKGRRGGWAALVALRLDLVRGISARKRAPHPLPNPPPSRGRGFWFTQRRRGAEEFRGYRACCCDCDSERLIDGKMPEDRALFRFNCASCKLTYKKNWHGESQSLMIIETDSAVCNFDRDRIRWTSSNSTSVDPDHYIDLPVRFSQNALQRLISTAKILGNSDSALPRDPVRIPKNPSKKFYKQYSSYFYRSYFYKNLYKSLILSHIFEYHLKPFSSFIDIGSGSSPFSAAICLNQHVQAVQLIDRSKAQLNIGRKILKKISPETIIDTQVRLAESVNFPSKTPIIASYVFCEMIYINNKYKDIISNSDFILILDDQITIKNIYNDFIGQKRITSGHVEFDIFSEISDLVEGASGQFSYILLRNSDDSL